MRVLLGIAIAITMLSGCQSAEDKARQERFAQRELAREKKRAERIEAERVKLRKVNEAMAKMSSKLRDPESARYDDVSLFSTGYVCGKVNSKNGFGGYAGASEFVANGNQAFIDPGNDFSGDIYQKIESTDLSLAFMELRRNHCSGSKTIVKLRDNKAVAFGITY